MTRPVTPPAGGPVEVSTLAQPDARGASASPGGRFLLGQRVRVREDGRTGTVAAPDLGAVPYVLVWVDGLTELGSRVAVSFHAERLELLS
jgi:hypothetical protein